VSLGLGPGGDSPIASLSEGPGIEAAAVDLIFSEPAAAAQSSQEHIPARSLAARASLGDPIDGAEVEQTRDEGPGEGSEGPGGGGDDDEAAPARARTKRQLSTIAQVLVNLKSIRQPPMQRQAAAIGGDDRAGGGPHGGGGRCCRLCTGGGFLYLVFGIASPNITLGVAGSRVIHPSSAFIAGAPSRLKSFTQCARAKPMPESPGYPLTPPCIVVTVFSRPRNHRASSTLGI
jgi:hypothetical protein